MRLRGLSWFGPIHLIYSKDYPLYIFLRSPTIDGDLITDSPHTLLSQGQFANKPFITGNNKDEGTRFVPIWINGTSFGLDLINLAEPVDPSNETLAQLIIMYPDDPSLGS
ncbi:hypothetical protein I309_05063 [Cryptococcus deuterogattii LA55]|nr:hypothetical protein I309_05063 [Cryptococcus deuterogattii LA55]